MLKSIVQCLSVLLLAACAHTDLYNSGMKAEGARIVALQGPRLPWVMRIERELRQAGFQVLRWESTQKVTELESPGRIASYNAASTSYILRIEGEADLSWAQRCMGGGFNFSYISAELIDVRSNQSLASYSGQGYSEGCAPLSGKIFANITNMVLNAWAP
jgi:hypothetical protein